MVADEVEQILAFGIPLKDKENNTRSIGEGFTFCLGLKFTFGPKKRLDKLKKFSQA